jgi:ketosteroid isomerase-like protein
MDALHAFLDAIGRGALDEAAACFSADGAYREAHKVPIHGRTAIAEHFARFASLGTAWRFVVDDVLRDGERACVEYRFAVRGGTGEPWRERAGCATVRFTRDGEIAEWREYEG